MFYCFNLKVHWIEMISKRPSLKNMKNNFYFIIYENEKEKYVYPSIWIYFFIQIETKTEVFFCFERTKNLKKGKREEKKLFQIHIV